MPTWNFPHPCPGNSGKTLRIRLETSKLPKLLLKHVLAEWEPWQDWLDAETLSMFRSMGDGDWSQSSLAFARFEEQFARQVERCLTHRLTLRFYRPPILTKSKRWLGHWLFILPVGAMVILRTDGGDENVQTCYFHKRACREPDSRERCRVTLKKFVERYTRVEESQRRLPNRVEEFVVPTELGQEVHTGVEFCTTENWGFAADGTWSLEQIRDYPEAGTGDCRSTPFQLAPAVPAKSEV